MGERDGRSGIAGTDGKERKSGIGSLVTGALGARSADARGSLGGIRRMMFAATRPARMTGYVDADAGELSDEALELGNVTPGVVGAPQGVNRLNCLNHAGSLAALSRQLPEISVDSSLVSLA